MRRNKGINKIEKNPPSDLMSPWEFQEDDSHLENFVELPSHRKQIVKKILKQIQGKKNTLKNWPIRAQDPPQSKKVFPARSLKSQKGCCRLKSKTESAEGTDLEEEFKIFMEEVQLKKRSIINAKVIDMNTIFERGMRKNSKEPRICPSPSTSLSKKKMRIKEEIKARKTLEPSLQRQSKTMVNIFKNPFYLYEYGQVETPARPTVFRPMTAKYYRGSSRQKKSAMSRNYIS